MQASNKEGANAGPRGSTGVISGELQTGLWLAWFEMGKTRNWDRCML